MTQQGSRAIRDLASIDFGMAWLGAISSLLVIISSSFHSNIVLYNTLNLLKIFEVALFGSHIESKVTYKYKWKASG